MNEFFAILDDMRTGALPASEIPGFVAWAFRGIAWTSLAVLAGFGVAWLIFG